MNRETKPRPSMKKKKNSKCVAVGGVLERAKCLSGFDYSLTMGPLYVCIYQNIVITQFS